MSKNTIYNTNTKRSKRSKRANILYTNNYKMRDWFISRLGFSTYQEYLSSDRWKAIRAKVFEIKGRNCSICRCPATAIHHQDYSMDVLRGTDKGLEHLHPICYTCHTKVELDSDGNKRKMKDAIATFNKLLKTRPTTPPSKYTSYIDIIIKHTR